MNSCINDPVCERCGEKAAYAYEPVTIKMDADTFVELGRIDSDDGEKIFFMYEKCAREVIE
jgi:hypothetical protein